MLKCECVSNEHNHGIGLSNRCNRPAVYRVRITTDIFPGINSPISNDYSVCQYCIRSTDKIVATLKTSRKSI